MCAGAQSCPILCIPMDGIALQALLSMGFSKQEYWSGFSCPPPEDLPNPGIEPASLMSPALAGGFFTTELPEKPLYGRETSKHSFSLIINLVNW